MSKPQPIRTHWHQLLGKLLELVLTSLGIKVHVDFNLMSKPPRSDILLLRRDPHQLTWTIEQRACLPDGIRDSSASHILAELKYTEAITSDVLEKVHGYDIFYRTTHELKKSEVATFILSSHTTKKELLAEYGYEEVMGLPGVYRSDYPMVSRVTVLMLNELRDVPHNAFMKCFASRSTEKRKAFRALMGMGFSVLSNLSSSLWMFLAGLRRAMLGQGDEEMRVITPDDIMALGKQMQEMLLESMSIEERLKGLDSEERLKGLRPEERLKGLRPEERLKGLRPEERLKGLRPEERLRGLNSEERLKGLRPEERLRGLNSEERLKGLRPEERLRGLNSEERLKGLKPEERLKGLRPEEVLSQYKTEEVLSQYKPEEVLSQYKPEEVLSRYKPQLEQRECQGALKLLKRTLQIRFQVPPAYFENRLEGLPLETLELLSEAAVTANTLLEFETKLNELTIQTAP